MGIRRGKPLKIIFLEFFIGIICIFILVGVVNLVGYLGATFSGAFRPANYSEKQILKVYEELQNYDISRDLVPQNIEYVLFDKEYNIIDSSLDNNKSEVVKKFLKGGLKSDGREYFFHIKRKDGFISLKYQYKVTYKNNWMNRNLPSPLEIFIVLYLIESIVGFVIITVFFSRKIERGMDELIVAAREIEGGNLDFTCGNSNIREVDRVIDSIEKMKYGLKESLNKQWNLQQQNREEIAALAHDIKTPMTVVRGNSELIEETELTKEQREYNDYIIEGAKEIEKYIEILIKTANEEKEVEHPKEMIYMKDFSEGIKNSAIGIAGNKSKIIFEDKTKVESFFGNKDRIMRALNNIILNGIQHSSKTEENDNYLKITVEEDETNIIIMTQDNGNGFSSMDIKKCKEKFYINDQSRGSRTNHGMGLYIADRIIKDNHGELIIKNSSEGGCVVVTIPKMKETSN